MYYMCFFFFFSVFPLSPTINWSRGGLVIAPQDVRTSVKGLVRRNSSIGYMSVAIGEI